MQIDQIKTFYLKVVKVIDSCISIEQLITAKKYVNFFILSLPNYFDVLILNELNLRLRAKYHNIRSGLKQEKFK